MEMTYPCGASAVGEGEIPGACPVHGVECFRDQLVWKLEDTFGDPAGAARMVARFEAALRSALAPPVGVSLQPDTRRDCTCLGTCKGADGLSPRYRCALSPASLTPVEPTPEPPTEIARKVDAFMESALKLDRLSKVEPAPPTPAPCVWRETTQKGHDVATRWATGCGREDRTSPFLVEQYAACHFCGHPLQITR